MLNKLLKIPFIELYYLLIAFILLTIFKIAILLFPFNQLQAKFQRITTKKLLINTQKIELNSKALAINRIAYVFSFLGFSCLPKAMAYKYWLRKTNNLKLHFGVQKDPKNQFIAHAWITQGHETILGADANINYKSIWVWG